MLIQGTDLNLFISGDTGYTAMGSAKSCTLEVSAGVIETSSKDSGKWSEKIAGRLSYTVSADGMLADNGNNYDTIFTKMLAKEPIAIAFSTDAATKGYIGTAIITKVSQTGELDNVATYSISLEGTGELKPRA